MQAEYISTIGPTRLPPFFELVAACIALFLPPSAPLPLLLGSSVLSAFPCTATFRHSRRSICYPVMFTVCCIPLIVVCDTALIPATGNVGARAPCTSLYLLSRCTASLFV
ncbi:hypothetical protein C8R47DRAFT_1088670 [Mycena vitilis]|nr:hypothetical protein C8R47DRAFT_1088670 [Mycena vitilis]